MKKILWIFCILLVQVAVGQTIRGVVTDQKTQAVIPYAAIYFSGTSTGATSDTDGHFELDISKYVSMPLTVSCIGYYSTTIANPAPGKTLRVQLEPKEFEINEVVVSAQSLARRKRANLRLFRTVFIGNTPNALSCIITNENDLTFNYGPDRDTLRAFASKPVLIHNRALGYRIAFYLDKFEYDRKTGSFSYRGNIFFTEDSAASPETRQVYEANRAKTFLGSRLHFFRALWRGNLAASGFEVMTPDGKPVVFSDMTKQETLLGDDPPVVRKYFSFPSDLKVYYGNSVSTLSFLKPRVFFDKSGFCEDSALLWEGEMVVKRIGDDLPFDYVFPE